MNRINNAADGGNRQIQPRDFSFLSEADQFLEKAMVSLVWKLHGYGSPQQGKAVVFSGMEMDWGGASTSDLTMGVTEGLFVYEDRIWSFPGWYWWKNGHISNLSAGGLSLPSYYSEVSNLCAVFKRNTRDGSYDMDAEPSPVYHDNGGSNLQDMYVHTFNDCEAGVFNCNPNIFSQFPYHPPQPDELYMSDFERMGGGDLQTDISQMQQAVETAIGNGGMVPRY